MSLRSWCQNIICSLDTAHRPLLCNSPHCPRPGLLIETPPSGRKRGSVSLLPSDLGIGLNLYPDLRQQGHLGNAVFRFKFQFRKAH